VTYAARVDEQGQVFIDVSNGTRAPIVVTSFVLRFLGAHDKVLREATSDCEADCTVARAPTEAFGPFETPEDWQTVQVDEVLYDEAAPMERAPARKAPGPVAPSGDTRRRRCHGHGHVPLVCGRLPARAPRAAVRSCTAGWSAGDYTRARQMYTTTGREGAPGRAGEAGFEAWRRRRRRRDGRRASGCSSPSGVARRGARRDRLRDDSKALRRVHCKQEDGGWKVERIETLLRLSDVRFGAGRRTRACRSLWVLAAARRRGLRYLDRVPAGSCLRRLRAEDFAGPPPTSSSRAGWATRSWSLSSIRAMPAGGWIHTRSAGVDRMLSRAGREPGRGHERRGVFGRLGSSRAAVLFFA